MAFQIIRNDITKVRADAIVNTANTMPTFAGGTDYAIYQAAGSAELLAARKKIGIIEPGEAAETPAFKLKADYIIHTVGPIWHGGNEGEFDILRHCYENSLALAAKLGCKSVAFPLISTGTFGFPKDKALQIALAAIQSFLLEHSMLVTLVVFDRKAFELSGSVVENVREYVDTNYVEAAGQREYHGDNIPSRVLDGGKRRIGASVSRLLNRKKFRLTEESVQPEYAEPKEAFSGDDGSVSHEEYACSFCDEENDEESCREAAILPDSEDCIALGAPSPAEQDTPDTAADRVPFPLINECRSSEPNTRPLPAQSAAREKGAKAERKKFSPQKPHVDIEKLVAGQEKTFQERLFEIIDERGLTGPQVYKSYVSKQVYSKLQCDRDYHPTKYTAVALCLSLHLDLDQTKDLIGRAGWALSPSSKSDLVVMGCIMNEEYNVMEINSILFDLDCPMLEKIK